MTWHDMAGTGRKQKKPNWFKYTFIRFILSILFCSAIVCFTLAFFLFYSRRLSIRRRHIPIHMATSCSCQLQNRWNRHDGRALLALCRAVAWRESRVNDRTNANYHKNNRCLECACAFMCLFQSDSTIHGISQIHRRNKAITWQIIAKKKNMLFTMFRPLVNSFIIFISKRSSWHWSSI